MPISMKDLADGLAEVQGEMAAIKAFLTVMIGTHPNLEALESGFKAVSEGMTASFLPHPQLSDETIKGMQNVSGIIAEQIAQARQARG